MTTVPALIVVDMQNYYLKCDSPYHRYFNTLQPGCLDYIIDRCAATVIPNITAPHRTLSGNNRCRSCLPAPLRNRPGPGRPAPFFPGPLPEGHGWRVLTTSTRWKATPAPMSSTKSVRSRRKQSSIRPPSAPSRRPISTKCSGERGSATLVFTGLATSQCVETTARDASDRGFSVMHIEDAQADYDEMSHTSSLYSSQGVCGGDIVTTEEYILDCAPGR